jgi:glycerol-3-phosphate acyltransferase PlsY
VIREGRGARPLTASDSVDRGGRRELFVTAAVVLIPLVAYLAGSIPFGLLLCRWIAGVDLRTVGSGNIGATNATRVLGKTWGTIVLLLDALKGLLPTLLLPWLLNVPSGDVGHWSVLAGVCAILGHSYPVWLQFRGGKGVATSLGVIAILAPWGMLVAAGLFAATFAVTRIVSLGSLIAAVGFGVFQWVWLQPAPWSAKTWSLTTFSLAIPLLIVVRHRSNIVRLLRGEEQALRTKEKPKPPAE